MVRRVLVIGSRNIIPYCGLDRPQHMRFVWRWCRCGCVGSGVGRRFYSRHGRFKCRVAFGWGGFSLLCTPTGPSVGHEVGYIHMEGREVFRSAVTYLSDIADEVMRQSGVTAADLNYVPHQANVRIIEATAKKLGLPMEKVALTLPAHGNTSAASIPMALYETIKSGRVRTGDLILLDSMGAGFTWAAALVRL